MKSEVAMVINPKSKQWSGELPDDCKWVKMQWLDTDGEWKPPIEYSKAREKEFAIAAMEKALSSGAPCKFEQYRLIQVEVEEDQPHKEIYSMATKKKAVKKGAKKEKGAPSLRDKVAAYLSDGKPHTAEQIVKGTGATIGNWAKGSARTYIRDFVVALQKGGVDIDEPEKGTFQMKRGGAAAKKARKKKSVEAAKDTDTASIEA